MAKIQIETDYISQGSKKFRQANFAFFAAGFVTFITLYNVQPLMPEFTSEFGISAALASLPLSVTTCTLAIGMLIAGTASETLGRKPVMVMSLFATSLLSLVTAFSQTFPMLVFIRLLQGVALAGLPSVAMAYLGEEIEPKAVGRAMGLYISGNAIGGMSGRILTAMMTDFYSWRFALGFIGIFCLALSIYFVLRLPASKHCQRRPFRLSYLFTSLYKHLCNPLLLCLYALSFCIMGGFVTLYNYIAYRLLEQPYSMSHSMVSLIFLVYFLGSFASSITGGLVNRFGRRQMVRTGIIAMLVGVIITMSALLPLIIFGVAIFTAGFFATHSVASSWVGRYATTAKAQASSLYLFAYYLGSSVSGTLGGFLWARLDWNGVAGLIIILLAAAFSTTMLSAYIEKKTLVPAVEEPANPSLTQSSGH